MVEDILASLDVWHNCPAALLAVSADLGSVLVNPEAEKLLAGLKKGEEVHHTASKLVGLLREKGLFRTAGPDAAELQHAGVWVSVKVSTATGEYFLLLLRAIDEEIALKERLSELQEVTNELAEIVELSADGLVCVDRGGNIVRLNKAYERILGIEGEKFIGKSAQLLLQKGYLTELVSPKVIAEGKPQTIVSRVKNKDVLISGHPVFDENGAVARVIANIRDLTELNRLKDEVSKYHELTNRYKTEIHHLRARELEATIIGHSDSTRKMVAIAEQASKVDSTVLIYGETGTGKELLVKSIHRASRQKHGPFIAVNCSTIPETLMESELFGYESGTFTGSDKGGKVGLFEAADGGTIFLDEISDMPLSMQAKLLRVIQERRVRRIGASSAREIDVRLIAASNKRLEQCIEEKQFRQDLFYRLNIINIEIPPLRQRKEDIPLLVNHFLGEFNKKFGRDKRITEHDMDMLLTYDWPGNIRELRNVVERFVVLGDAIHLENVLFPSQRTQQIAANNPISCLKSYLKTKEAEIITDTYNRCKSTRKTAELLNVSQSSVVRKLHKTGVGPDNLAVP